MILASENEKDHDQLITTVLERAKANSIKFNLHKIQLKKSEVTYMGNIIGNGVVKPDYEKVRAIVEMPAPTCKKDIQRLLGMLNYLSQYIPNMSTITVPLRNLFKKDVPFEWNFEQEEAFEKIKGILSSPESLRIYDPKIVGSMDQESSQQLQMWFSEHFFAPKLAGLIVTPIVSGTVEQKWLEKMSEKPQSIRLLR